MLNKSIIKAYDIRGIYPKEINEKIFYKIGNSIKTLNSPKTIIIGNDMRKSSQPLKKALIKGLQDAGINIIDIGLCSTPMFYYATHHFKIDLGLMITASHNPKQYNGIKISKKNAIPMDIQGNTKFINQIEKNNIILSKQKGKIIKKDFLKTYTNFIKKQLKIKKPLKVVIDTANGMGGLTIPQILKDKVKLIHLYPKLDGSFPNHEANPIKEKTLKTLKKEVIKQKADLGIAYDGDADRIGIIDEKGNYVQTDLITALFCENYLKNTNQKKFGYDLRSSLIVPQTIKELGGIPYKLQVGNPKIKNEMIKKGINFSGEISGHFFFKFKKNLIFDSSEKATTELLNILSKSSQPLSKLIQKYKKYYHLLELNFKIKDKNQIIIKLKKYYKNGKTEQLDGLSVYFNNWWFNIRPSNTEDLLRLSLEAKDKQTYTKELKNLRKLIKN